MQKARADISPVDDRGTEICSRILFDSGSQRSYISEKVRIRLQLQSIRTEKVIIRAFGEEDDSKVQRLDIVQFKVRNKSYSRFTLVEAMCVPTICSPLANQNISKGT